jgi:hypothetical protein
MHGQVFKLGGTQVGRSPAAIVQLHHRTRAIQATGNLVNFPFQPLEIWKRNFVVPVYYDVAPAEEAEAPAKGKVDIQGKRPGRMRVVRFTDDAFVILPPELPHPFGCGRIARITRARHVVSVDYLLGDIKDPGFRARL